MTTQEAIESTYQPAEISKMLAEIADELAISPPCNVTNEYFKIRLISLIRHNRKHADILNRYQAILVEVTKL